MKQKFPIISFIGWHNSGKTTLIRKVASELKDRGFKIGILKSTHHNIISHKPGSDTDLYSKDGIKNIGLIGATGSIFYTDNTNLENPLWISSKFLSNVDIIICEGFKHSPHISKIEVVSSNPTKESLLKDQVPNVIALAIKKEYKELYDTTIPIFDKEDVKGLADFILSYLFPYKDKQQLYLFVNGRLIPLKRYVRDSFKGVIEGFIKALKGTQGAKDIEIKIKKED